MMRRRGFGGKAPKQLAKLSKDVTLWNHICTNAPPFVDDRFHFIMCPPDALKQIMPVLYISTDKSQWDQG
jgi:hypothetical protein